MKTTTKLFLIFFIWFIFITISSVFAQDTLKMLVWEGYAPPEQVKKFEALIREKYGKPVKLQVSHNVSDVQDFYDAIRGRRTHIISPAHNIIKDMRFGYIRKKLVMPVSLNNIPNYKDVLPTLQNAEYITDDKNRVYGVPFTPGPYGLAYNTAFFKQAPASWNVLWDPAYKGKYTISGDYYEANVYITALSEGLRGKELYDYDILKQKKITDKLRRLARNARSFWEGVDTEDDLKGLALATTWGFAFDDLKKRGEIWKMADPAEGTTGWVDSLLMSSELENKPFLKSVAEEWMNFILSPDFQVDVVVRQLMSDPVNVRVKDRLTPEEIIRHHLDNPDYYKTKIWLWPTFETKRERNALKVLWDEAIEGIKEEKTRKKY